MCPHRRFVWSCQVLELLRRRDQYSEENFDAMGLLQTLCLVKMDTMDGNNAASKQVPAKPRTTEPARSSSGQKAEGAENCSDSPNSDTDKQDQAETEMKGEQRRYTSKSDNFLQLGAIYRYVDAIIIKVCIFKLSSV